MVPSFEAFAIEVVPAISDDVVEQVRTKLLVLGGQILQYRALDVEQIGSVHEGIMGFAVERASGPSPGITHRPAHQRIMITVVVNAEQLLAQAGAKRANWLEEQAGVKLKLAPPTARVQNDAPGSWRWPATRRFSATTPPAWSWLNGLVPPSPTSIAAQSGGQHQRCHPVLGAIALRHAHP